jgi:predicted nucleic acid-binding protein
MYILDTNVVSELRKVSAGKADINVTNWAKGTNANDLYLSVITIQELEYGVLLAERKDPGKGSVLRAWLNSQVIPAFTGRILSVDLQVARRHAHLNVPDPRPFRDGLIAATALVYGMTVVTRNVEDFNPTGVAVINPWYQ